MTVARAHRTQRERSAETIAKLLDATIDLLHDLGFSRLSTPDIAAAAGVSRGALTHHFASKEEIVVAAIARQLAANTETLYGLAADLRRRGGSTDEIVDFLWRLMSDRLFYVTMEYLPEARHNRGFRASLVPVVRTFHAGLDAVWAELAEQAGLEVEPARVLLNATMCMIRGMIAQTALRDDPAYFETLLTFWKRQVAQAFADARIVTDGPDRPPTQDVTIRPTPKGGARRRGAASQENP